MLIGPISVGPERLHILGKREMNELYYSLMNVTVNTFILASVNSMLVQFIFVQYGTRFQAQT